MRTTITIDDGLARRLQDRMRATGTSFRKTLETVLERGLEDRPNATGKKAFKVEAKAMGLRPGVDPARLHDLDTDLEVDAFSEVSRRLQTHS